MAVVNRYTQTTPARYTPRTLQELMVAPAYMRERHSELEGGMADVSTGVANADYLDVHDSVAKEAQQKLYDEVTQQADILNQEGFNPAAKSRFLKLNKEFQQSMGPKGTLGKAAAAKQSYLTQSQELLKNATAMGYGPDGVKDKLNEAYLAYKERFEATGEIENFEATLPPAFQDLQKDIIEMGREAGTEAITKMKQNDYSFMTDPQTGALMMVNKNGHVIETSNIEGLENAKNYLENKWLAKGGQGTQSATWQNLTPEMIASQINSGLGLQKDYSFDDRRTTDYKYIKGDTKANYKDDFLAQYIKGYDIGKLTPGSPLISIQDINAAEFDENGNIITKDSKYATYKDKALAIQADYPESELELDESTGTYMLHTTQVTQQGGRPLTVKISKEGNHLKEELDKIRKQHPDFNYLTDEDLKNRLNLFKDKIGETFTELISPLGSDYTEFGNYLFGSITKEKAAGSMPSFEVTMDGTSFTSDMLLDNLGYGSNQEDFKVKGKPAIHGYVPALKKIKATVYNSSGEAKDIFIEAPKQMVEETELTARIGEAMLRGNVFENLGQDAEGNYMYMVNDFTDGNPMIYFSKNPNIENAKQLLTKRIGGWNPSDEVTRDENGNPLYMDFATVYAQEKMELRRNDFYNTFIGKGED